MDLRRKRYVIICSYFVNFIKQFVDYVNIFDWANNFQLSQLTMTFG